jgi:hypothetical protein
MLVTIQLRDHGIATLSTSTGNPAMVRVNQRLGFRVESTEVRLVKTLHPPNSPLWPCRPDVR